MIHYSVLIPQQGAIDSFAYLLPQLCAALGDLILPYEIIAIDDASVAPAAAALDELVHEYPALRVLRFDRPRGTSASLSAGIAAARGDLVIALDPGNRQAPSALGQLISRLSQHDLVFVEREASSGARRAPWSRLPRLLAAQARLDPSEELFWAARHEAVKGLALARGAFRVLPALLASRGFRVCRLKLAWGLPPRGAKYTPGIVERMAIRWLDRSFEPHLACEVTRGGAELSPHVAVRVPGVRDVARPRYVPQPAVAPVEKDRHESA